MRDHVDVPGEDVVLEGGERDGQRLAMSAMTHDGVGRYVLHDTAGVYVHDSESLSDYRDGQRRAVFEPSETGI